MSDRTYRVRLEAALGNFRQQMEQAASSVRRVGSAATKASGETTKAHESQRRSLATYVQQNEESFKALEATGKWMSTRITAPMVAFGGAVAATGVSYNDLEQRSRGALTTILGSAEAATAQMERLHAFGRESPFPRQIFIEAQQQLLGFGMEAERVIPVLGAVQDAVAATGGTAQDLSEVVDVIARIEGQGRITGVELQRLGIRGIDAAGMIGDAMGMSGDEIRTQITAGAIDAETAIDALVAGIDGKMGGAAQNMRATWSGAIDRVKGAWRDLSSAIVEPFVSTTGGGLGVDAANVLADSLRSLEAAYRDLEPAQQGMVIGVTGLVAGVGPAVWTVGRLGRAAINTVENFRDMRGALSATRQFLTGPWGIAMAGASLGLMEFARRAGEMRAAGQNIASHLGDVREGADALSDAWMRNQLSDAGVLGAWDQLGLSADTLRGAIRGVPEDVATVNGALRDSRSVWNDLSDASNNLSFGLVGSQNQYRELHRVVADLGAGYEDVLPLFEEAERLHRSNETSTSRLNAQAEAYGVTLDGAGRATGDYAGTLDDLEGGLDGVADATVDADQALQSYLDTQRAAVDPVFALERALGAVEQAERDYAAAVKEHGAASDEAASATWSHMSALADLEQAALNGDLSFFQFSRRLRGWVEDGRITAEQADQVRGRVSELRGEAEAAEGDYAMSISADATDAEGAFGTVGRLADAWAARTDTSTADTDASPAEGAFGRGVRIAEEWGGRTDTSTIDGDEQPATDAIGTASALARIWDLSTYTGTIDANDDPARSAVRGFQDWITGIFENPWTATISATVRAVFGGFGDGPGAPGGGGGAATARARQAMQGLPLRISSTYRSPAHNARVGGSPTSYHMDRNNPATDIAGPTWALDIAHSRLRAMGGNRELIWRAPGHWDHVHVAHTGGEVAPGWPTMPGLRPDERPAVLQLGEEVLAKREAQAYRDAIGAVPRYHSGTLSGAVGIGSELARVVAALERVTREMDRTAKQQQVAGMRSAVLDARKEAADADTSQERRAARQREAEASKRYAEFLAKEAQEHRKIQLEIRQARLEEELRIATNRQSWMFSRMSTDQQIRDLTRRLAAERRFSDEWMQLDQQRQQILDREAADARLRYDELLRDLDAHLDRAHELRATAAERTADMLDQRAEQLSASMSLDFGDDAWDWTAGSILSQMDRQLAELDDWQGALAEVAARGLDQDAIELLGLDRSPEALGQLKVLLRSTDDELAAISQAAGRRQRSIADAVASERLDGQSQLGREILDVERQLGEDLAEIGQDTGRSYTDAIAEAMASGIPGVVAVADQLQAALRDVQQAERAAAAPAPGKMSRADQIRQVWTDAGVSLAFGSESAEQRLARLVASGRSIADLRRSAQIQAIQHPATRLHDGGLINLPPDQERIAVLRGQEVVQDVSEVYGRQAAQAQVVVVETIREVIPDGTVVEMHSNLGEVVRGTIRTEQASHDGRLNRTSDVKGRQKVRA